MRVRCASKNATWYTSRFEKVFVSILKQSKRLNMMLKSDRSDGLHQRINSGLEVGLLMVWLRLGRRGLCTVFPQAPSEVPLLKWITPHLHHPSNTPQTLSLLAIDLSPPIPAPYHSPCRTQMNTSSIVYSITIPTLVSQCCCLFNSSVPHSSIFLQLELSFT